MANLEHKHLKNLRLALLSLKPASADGFEGLIGIVLAKITGAPFRLAGSGSQFGIDGKEAYDVDGICFEAKRYDGQIPRAQVLSKLAELSINGSETDLWVLGATTSITNQLATDIGKLGKKNGIATLILDWAGTTPPLAVALAMADRATEEFFRSNIVEDTVLLPAVTALAAIKESTGFDDHAEHIRAALQGPAIGVEFARRANTGWLVEAFSSRQNAKRRFGQPLSPGTSCGVTVRPRNKLIDKLQPALVGKPDGKAVCVLGGEGNGKSWIVVQSWLSLERRPLLILMCPEEFSESAQQIDMQKMLISTLIRQTGETESDSAFARWARRFTYWQNDADSSYPRIVVVIDGLNQRPKTDWARIIELFGYQLDRIGGRLIVTSRTTYFAEHVEKRLTLPTTITTIPEWSNKQRNEILTDHGVTASELCPLVAKSLSNPRLLGIALELLKSDDIEDFAELTISRLLFEYIRANERDAPTPQSAVVFARQLQTHANEILSRITAQQLEDLRLFEGGLDSVADGRFFHSVEGDSTRYTLDEDGLILALGFSVIDRLLVAQRNGKDLQAELETIIEPIAALDHTANVVLAALTVTCIDENYPSDIAAALIGTFSALQNLDQDRFASFAGLARNRPRIFMRAASHLCTVGGRHPNFDWIEAALVSAREVDNAWTEMSAEIRSWLSSYTLSPEIGMIAHVSRDPAEKVEEERAKRLGEIENRLNALSETEKGLLEELTEADGSASVLCRLALILIAGKPVAPFVKSLVHWSFANSLNRDRLGPHAELTSLIRFNNIDWRETRELLLRECTIFQESNTSSVGRWALVSLMHATGDPDDATVAQAQAEELTKDRPHFEGWRLVEDYCATDPCDPDVAKPDNMRITTAKYKEIDVASIRKTLGTSQEDHFFAAARPAVARFASEIAIGKHREFASDVLGRQDLPLRQGLFELRAHNSLLTRDNALELLTKREKGRAADTTIGEVNKDRWLVSQHHFLLAFPLLSGREQVEELLADVSEDPILLDLMDVAQPLEAEVFDNLLADACINDVEYAQYVLIAFARETKTQISPSSRTRLASLIHSESERVRAQLLGLIAQLEDENLLGLVAGSEWRAHDGHNENGHEYWYGSIALLKAAARGLISSIDVLDRISPRCYGRAVKTLDSDAVYDISLRVDASIHHAAGLRTTLEPPDIEYCVESDSLDELVHFSIAHIEADSDDLFENLARQSETSEIFAARQKIAHDSFFAFVKELTRAKARIILDHFDTDEFEIIVSSNKNLADKWYELFFSLSATQLPIVYNLILLLAHVIFKSQPAKAAALYDLISESGPLIRATFGPSGVPLDAMTIWSGPEHAVLRSICFDRLDSARNDADLFVEVLAALINGKEGLLVSYIETKQDEGVPAGIARALMIVGFSNQSTFNDEFLAKQKDVVGFLGGVRDAAQFAYERNIWAQTWFGQMCKAQDPSEFWCASTLFTKIVDGRYTTWRSEHDQCREVLRRFGPSVASGVQNRVKKWQRSRTKTLFGGKVPDHVFLES